MSDSDTTNTKERPGPPRQWVRDLNEGDHVSGCFAVRTAPEKMGGSSGVKVLVGDFDDVTAFTWKLGAELRGVASRAGGVVHLEGTFSVHPEYGSQIEVKNVRAAAEGEYDPLQLYPVFAEPLSELERRLDDLVGRLDPERSFPLIELTDRLILTGPTAEMWRNVPAPILKERAGRSPDEARDGSSIYGCRHGLIASTVIATEGVSQMAKVHGWPHDLAVVCGLVKYVGMVEALEALEIGFGTTAEGRSEKLPTLSYFLVRNAIREIEGFPEEATRALRHVTLANAEGTSVPALIRVVSGVCDIVDTTLKDGVFVAAERAADPDATWGPYSDIVGGPIFLGPRSA